MGRFRVLACVSIALALFSPCDLGYAQKQKKTVSVSVVNQSTNTVTVYKGKDQVGVVEAGQSSKLNVPDGANLQYTWGTEQEDPPIATAAEGQRIFIRDPGIEFRFTRIYCLVGDDEGPHSIGDAVELNANITVSCKHGLGRSLLQQPEAKHMYVEGLDDYPSTTVEFSKDQWSWTFPMPETDLDDAILTISWSDVWEEDNASSSEDDTLTVDDNNRQLTNLYSDPKTVVDDLEAADQYFTIIGTDRNNPDAHLRAFYLAKAVDTFEVKKK